MTPPLRILHIEDDRNDAELVRTTLETDGLAVDVHVVDSPGGFGAALERSAPDVVLSDFALPLFDGLSALRMTRARYPDVPFIIVSGTLGEEAAVESVRQGATDYVLKQRLTRLGTSVRRAISEADERKRRKEAEEALHESEAQLRQAQKMEAIGRLAGGVAHDFNNILTVIIGHSELARERAPVSSEVRKSLEEIGRAAQKAAALTRQLLAFSRRQVLAPRPLDLNAIIGDMERMLARLIGADIDLRVQLDPNVGTVTADPSQIEQVILNLVVNARDAMPEGGVLTIETKDLRPDEVPVHAQEKDAHRRYASFTVRDTGCGMDDATRTKIFEPFFTTKELGKGTGLGLAMVHGIVQQSGGTVEVLSRLGEGAAFTVILPCVEAEATVDARAPEAESTSTGSETILVVEDDEMVRALACTALQAAGYTVLEAKDRDHAVVACESAARRGVPIALMLSDVVMPGMSRAAMAERAARTQPAMKYLDMSGYFEHGGADEGVLVGGDSVPDTTTGDGGAEDADDTIRRPFIQKPFTIGELLHTVRSVIDGKTPITGRSTTLR